MSLELKRQDGFPLTPPQVVFSGLDSNGVLEKYEQLYSSFRHLLIQSKILRLVKGLVVEIEDHIALLDQSLYQAQYLLLNRRVSEA